MSTLRMVSDRRMVVSDPAELALLLVGRPDRRAPVVCWDASEMRPSGVLQLVSTVRASARQQATWLPGAVLFVAGLACGVGWQVVCSVVGGGL